MTWKADGTRYNMLLLKYGAYLIDRSGEVRPPGLFAGTAVAFAARTCYCCCNRPAFCY